MFPEAGIYRFLSHHDILNKADELKAKFYFVLEFLNKMGSWCIL